MTVAERRYQRGGRQPRSDNDYGIPERGGSNLSFYVSSGMLDLGTSRYLYVALAKYNPIIGWWTRSRGGEGPGSGTA